MKISPTQVSLWRACNRKFAFQYLAGLPRTPQTAAQELGSALHSKVEQHLKGQVVLEGDAASRLFPHLVGYLPTTAVSEQEVSVNVSDTLTFYGYVDWLEERDGGLYVGDLKTTSNLKYAKTREQLAVDPQGLIYCMAAEDTFATTVKGGRWVYIQTKGAPKVREVEFQPDYTAVDALIADGEAIVKAWARKGADPNSFEPNLNTCDDYGGCPFKKQCVKNPADQLIQLGTRMGLAMEQTKMTFDEIMAKATGTAEDAESLVQELQSTADEAVNPPAAAVQPDTIPAPAEPAPVAGRRLGEEGARGLAAKPKRTRKAPDTRPAVPEAEDYPIGTLFLSSRPDHSPVLEDAYYIIASVSGELNSKAGVEDYRLMDYGKGAGVLVAGVVEKVKYIRPEELFLDERTPEGRLLSGPLSALAKRVVRGL